MQWNHRTEWQAPFPGELRHDRPADGEAGPAGRQVEDAHRASEQPRQPLADDPRLDLLLRRGAAEDQYVGGPEALEVGPRNLEAPQVRRCQGQTFSGGEEPDPELGGEERRDHQCEGE